MTNLKARIIAPALAAGTLLAGSLAPRHPRIRRRGDTRGTAQRLPNVD
jgi:hypothetical protein